MLTGPSAPASVAALALALARKWSKRNVAHGLRLGQAVGEELEQVLDAWARVLGVDAERLVALGEQVLPGRGQALDGLLELAPLALQELVVANPQRVLDEVWVSAKSASKAPRWAARARP